VSLPRAFVETGPLQGDRVTLTGEIHHHVHRVLRLGPGDALELFDGAGLVARGIIDVAAAGALTLRVDQRRRVEPLPGPPVTLICAELKGDKMDLVLQKATELGVDRFVPVAARRGVPRGAAAAGQRRHARRLKVAREACRQCGRAYLPAVEETQPLEAALARPDAAGAFVLRPRAESVGLAAALAAVAQGTPLCLLVGPEGGFTAEELAAARDRGFGEVSLGRSVLRAETAAVAAVTLACAQVGRLG
jgi:16S rRNA (uracil1498-N3)-methyltransferase